MRRVIVTLPEKEPQEGYFHVWGGTSEHIYAIVELDSGEITQPFAMYVKFLPEAEINLKWWEPV